MSASRTVVAMLAVVIALSGCDPGHSSKAPTANSANGGPTQLAKAATWTLGGVPCCTLIAVPAATPPVGAGACPGVRPRSS